MRYPAATWIGSPNTGGPIGAIRLGVIHVMQGTLASTDAWFSETQSQVSAHFGVGKDGSVHQYVDTSVVAWAEANYNDVAISIEHEGNTGDSLTDPQMAADQALVAWLNQTSGIPLVRTSDPNGTGWIGHGELGVAGGNHPQCPGQPILDQWPSVLIGGIPIPTDSFDTEHMETLMTLAASKQDALYCQIREWWANFRTDGLTGQDSQILAYCYDLPVANGGFGGSVDLLLAHIIDTASTYGKLRLQFAGAV